MKFMNYGYEPIAHIDTIYRLLIDEAYYRFQLPGNPEGIIISTDGDSRVDRCWKLDI